MSPLFVDSSQYPTRAVKFLWWTLMRRSTWKYEFYRKEIQMSRNELPPCLIMALLEVPYLCLKLIITLSWLRRKHLNGYFGAIDLAIVNFSEATDSKQPLEIVCNSQDIGIWIRSSGWAPLFCFSKQNS